MVDIQKTLRRSEYINEQHKAFAHAVLLGALADKHLSKMLEPFNLPVNKYRILRGLKKVYPEGVGVYKLKEFLVVGDADISRLVGRLVKRGLATRKKGKMNKSTMQVTITDQGIELIDTVQSHLSEFIEPFMCFTDDEARQLNQLIEKAVDSFTKTGPKSDENT